MDAQDKKQAKAMLQEELTLARKVGRMGQLVHRYHMLESRRHGGIGDPSRGQGRVLALLAMKPETTQRELSFLLDMRQQSLSELLAKLEEKGLITREKSTQDGRVTVVKLTEAGSKAAPSESDIEHQDDAFSCLDEAERTQFEALTDKVCHALEERLVELGDDPFAPPRGPRGGHGPRGLHGPRGSREPRPQDRLEERGPAERDLREDFPPHRMRRGWDGEGHSLRHA